MEKMISERSAWLKEKEHVRFDVVAPFAEANFLYVRPFVIPRGCLRTNN